MIQCKDIVLTYLCRAINKLPLTFATIMENIAKQTGWNITITAGGPCPNNEGKISTLMSVKFTHWRYV